MRRSLPLMTGTPALTSPLMRKNTLASSVTFQNVSNSSRVQSRAMMTTLPAGTTKSTGKALACASAGLLVSSLASTKSDRSTCTGVPPVEEEEDEELLLDDEDDDEVLLGTITPPEELDEDDDDDEDDDEEDDEDDDDEDEEEALLEEVTPPVEDDDEAEDEDEAAPPSPKKEPVTGLKQRRVKPSHT